MKKFFAVMMAAAMVLSFAACSSTSSSSEETTVSSEETTVATGTYTIYNTTGENVTELYLHEAGSEDKGENLAGEKLHNNHSIVATYEGDESTTLSLEWVTESGATGSFDTLHIEEAPIALLSADAAAGATMISFSAPEATGAYTVYNTTGDKVTELYLYETGSEDKGENLAGEGLDADASVELSYTAVCDAKLTLEWATEGGDAGSFTTLSIEEVPISLLSTDAAAGATMISFSAPDAE